MKLKEYVKYGIIEGIITAIVMFFFLCLIGCRTTQYVPIQSTTTETITIRDTVVKTVLVPYFDTVYIQKDTVSYLKNKYAESWARWVGGGLSHSLRVLGDTILVNTVYKDIVKTNNVQVPVAVEKNLTRWEKFKMDVGGWAIGALCGIVIIGIVYLVIRQKV